MTTLDVLAVQSSFPSEVGVDDDAEVGADDGGEVDHHSLKWYSIIKMSFKSAYFTISSKLCYFIWCCVSIDTILHHLTTKEYTVVSF